jgi:hypothetical protein
MTLSVGTATQMAQMSLAAQAGGTAMSTIGSFYSARSQQSALQSQANIADTNARIAELGAQQEMFRGEREVAALTLRAGQLKSTQRAGMAASGIDLGEGSAAEILTSTDLMKEIDTNTATANAVRSAWGYRTQATNYQNDALTKRASADTISPFGAAATSLLGGATSLASNYYKLDKLGAFKKTGGDESGALYSPTGAFVRGRR